MRQAAAAGVVFLCAMAPFAGSVRHGMADLDDAAYLQAASHVREGLNAKGVAWAFSNVDFGIWMPATWLVYMADRDIARTMAMARGTPGRRWDIMYSLVHGEMVLVHGVNAVLLFCLLTAILRNVLTCAKVMVDNDDMSCHIAALLALLWAVHPLRAESVVWLASLKDVLCQAGLLGGMLAWTCWRRHGGAWRYCVAMACLGWALMSKPAAMSFVALAATVDIFVLRVLSLRELIGDVRRSHWVKLARRLLPYLPPLAACVAVGLVAQAAQAAGGAKGFTEAIPMWYRMLNALVSIGVYAIHTIWPAWLAPQCMLRWPELPRMCLLGAVAGGSLLAWTLFRLRRNIRGDGDGATACETADFILAGTVWFLVSVAPMLGIAGFGGHAFADRFTYIPAVGISIALAGVLSRCMERRSGRLAANAFLSAAVLAYGTSAWRQTNFWKDDKTLWTHTLKVDGDGNFLAHMALGKWFYEREHDTGLKEAVRHFTRAYELDTRHSMNMSLIYMFLLGETGERERLEKLYFDFFAWIRTKYGFVDCIDQKIAEGIYLLYGKRAETGGRAKEIARGLTDSGGKDIYQLWYYVYLTGKLMRDDALEEKGREGLLRLSDPETGFDDTVRFRFLTDAWRRTGVD